MLVFYPMGIDKLWSMLDAHKARVPEINNKAFNFNIVSAKIKNQICKTELDESDRSSSYIYFLA